MQGKNISSWIQLILFTCFLFLLVAIPYTIYQKASEGKTTVQIVSLPSPAKPTPFLPITPPQASTTTACFTVPNSYQLTSNPSTSSGQIAPAAYFFQATTRQLCYPPILPPFPFTWQSYTSSQYGYTIDTPSNWLDKSTTIKNTVLHIFASEETSTTSAIATVSFAWYSGIDPYATQSSYLSQPITRDGKNGTVYTKNAAYVSAVFPLNTGYLLIEASRIDSAFYAFEHMLDSLQFSK